MNDKTSAIIRTALSAFPGGGTLATAWSEWDTTRRFGRIEAMFRRLEQDLSSEKGRFDPTKIGDEQLQLLEEVVRRVQVEPRELKRIGFAILLRSAWLEPEQLSFDETMHFVRALEDFDDLHIGVLKYLENQPSTAEVYPNLSVLADALHVSEDAKRNSLMPALDLLCERYRLVERNWTLGGVKQGMVLTGNLGPENLAGNCGHRITPLGGRFLGYVLEPGDPGA